MTTIAKPDPKPSNLRQNKAQKAAAEAGALVAAATLDEVATSATPAVLDAIKSAASASAARRALNAKDRETVKAKDAEATAKRKAATAALHTSFVEAFKAGKTIGQIAAEFVNPDTQKPRSAGAVRNVLIAAGLVAVGEARKPKFDLDTLDAERRVEIECAYSTLEAAANENGISIASLVKAFAKA